MGATENETENESSLAFVDVSIEAAANGISKVAAAAVLRHIADQWDPPTV